MLNCIGVFDMRSENPAHNAEQSQVAPVMQNSWLHVMKTLVKGSIMGATEVAIDHPLWVIKTRLQSKEIAALPTLRQKLQAARKRKGLYKGVIPNMASMVPITAAQVATASVTKKYLQSTEDRKMSQDKFIKQLKDVTAAFMGGAVSAAVGAPTELCMMHMTDNQNARATAKKVIQNSGIMRLYAGVGCTAVRDGIFTVGYLALPSVVEEQMNVWLPQYHVGKMVVSGPIAGVLAATASQPLDTIKTRQQEMALNHRMSAIEAGHQLVKENGVFSLFKGWAPRTLRVVSAITIMNTAGKTVEWALNMK